jgi:hypothetical protein
MEKAPFPAVIDNTMREAFRNCPTKFYWAHIRQKASATPSIHLHAGGAFAKGLEVTRLEFYQNGRSEPEAVALGSLALRETYGTFDADNGYTDHAKSCSGMLRAFEDYFMEYPLGRDIIEPYKTPDGKAALEFSFAIPTGVTHPVSGEPILYAGRFDMLGVRNGEAIYVVDEKTSGSLGQAWASQWDLNSQFTGYIMAAKHYGIPVAGAIIRGIGLLKTKITHQQVMLHRPDWQIERWWNQLHRDLRMMVAQWEADPGDGSEFDLALGTACSNYGGCGFKRLCMSPTPEDWIPVYYKDHTWSPLQVSSGD